MSDIVAHLSQADLNSIAELVRQSIANSTPHPPPAPDTIKLSPSDIQAVVAGMKDASSGTGVRILTSDGALHLVDDSKHGLPTKEALQAFVALVVGGFGAWLGWQNHKITKTQKDIADQKLKLDVMSIRLEITDVLDLAFTSIYQANVGKYPQELLKKINLSPSTEKDEEKSAASRVHINLTRNLQENIYKVSGILNKSKCVFSEESFESIMELHDSMRVTYRTGIELLRHSEGESPENFLILKRNYDDESEKMRKFYEAMWECILENEMKM